MSRADGAVGRPSRFRCPAHPKLGIGARIGWLRPSACRSLRAGRKPLAGKVPLPIAACRGEVRQPDMALEPSSAGVLMVARRRGHGSTPPVAIVAGGMYEGADHGGTTEHHDQPPSYTLAGSIDRLAGRQKHPFVGRAPAIRACCCAWLRITWRSLLILRFASLGR